MKRVLAFLLVIYLLTAGTALGMATGVNTGIRYIRTSSDTIPPGDAIPCPGIPTVIDYDGNTYNTVKIGHQCWMKEDLRTTHYPDGTDISLTSSEDMSHSPAYCDCGNPYCYNCDGFSNYGYLYNWYAVMHNSSSSNLNPSGVQGICPTGWHVPSDAEWTQLTDYVSSIPAYVCGSENDHIAKALASSSPYWYGSGNSCVPGNAQEWNNATGFNAIPMGNAYGMCWNSSFDVYYWSSTIYDYSRPWIRHLSHDNSSVLREYDGGGGISGYSVRCLLDYSVAVTTDWIYNVTTNSATSAGTVTSNCDYEISERGVCWSTSPNPTLDDSHTTDGSGVGSFTSTLTGLESGTTYYVRAYATGLETTYGNILTFTTLPLVSTNEVNNISLSTATCGGVVNDNGNINVVARGVCWSESHNPTLSDNHTNDGSGIGEFTSTIFDLQQGTTYYVRAYATTTEGTIYGNEVSFTTTIFPIGDAQPCPGPPTVTDYDGNVYNTVKVGGQCWLKENLRTTHYADGNPIEPLYAPNNDTSFVSSLGYFYTWFSVMNGNPSSEFTPSGVQGICPVGWHVPSPAELYTLQTYAGHEPAHRCGTSTANAAKALCDTAGWMYSGGTCHIGNNPESNNSTGFSACPAGGYDGSDYVDFGASARFWSSKRNGNMPLFYTLIYNQRELHSSYVNDEYGCSVRCLRDIVTAYLNNVTNVTYKSADCTAEVINNGNSLVTARGICWSTSHNPTISDNHTENGSGSGVFSAQMTLLQDNTTYYVRAYASLDGNIVYGGEVKFTTPMAGIRCAETPTVTDVDGNVYNTVQIGTQCWIKENLRTTHYASGEVIPFSQENQSTTLPYRYYPNNDSSLVTTYGYLYNWPAMMNGSASSNSVPSNVQGVCPNGWHVPSHNEWMTLIQYSREIDPDHDARPLASVVGWNNSINPNDVGGSPQANNSTGFSTLPAGNLQDHNFVFFNSSADYWAATEDGEWNSSYALHYSIACNRSYVYIYDNASSTGLFSKSVGNSVRCLRDTICSPSTSEFSVTSCNSYTWNEQTYTQSGDYTQTFTNAEGCDSVVTLHLTIIDGTHNVETVTACESYSWHGTTYTTSGTYTYAYTNANGCIGMDTLHLTVNSLPVLVLTATETNICVGGTTVITAEATGWNNDNVNYNWNNGFMGSSYIFVPNAAQAYTFTVTASQATSSCQAVASITINVNNPPAAPEIMVDNATICNGGHVTLTDLNAVAGAIYTWNRDGSVISGATQATLTEFPVTVGGNLTNYVYTAVVTLPSSGCVSAMSANVVVTVIPVPVADVSVDGNTTICEGGTTTLHANVTPANVTYNYQWYKDNVLIADATSADYIVAESARESAYNFTVVVSANAGCTATAAAPAITVVANPIVTATISQSITCVGGTATLSAMIEGDDTGVNDYTFNWYRNSYSNTQFVGNGTTYTTTGDEYLGNYSYYATAYSNYGCHSSSNVVDYTVVSDPINNIVISSGYSPTVCEGGGTALQTVVIGGYGWNTYQWYKNGNLLIGQTSELLYLDNLNSSNDTYSVEVVQTGAGCSSNASVALNDLVTVAPSYTVDITGFGNVCEGGTLALNATVNNVIPGDVLTYQWYKILNGNTTAVTDSDPNNNTYSTSNLLSAGSYDYYVVVTSDISGCSVVSNPVPVNVVAAPTVTIQSDNTVCEGGNFTLNAFINGGVYGANYIYTWSWNGSQSGSFVTSTPSYTTNLPASETPYYFTVTISRNDNTGCTAMSNAHEVNVLQIPTATVTANNSSVCTGGEVTFTANVSPVSSYNYVWTINGQQQAVNAASITTSSPNVGSISASVVVSPVNLASCSSTASNQVTVQVTEQPSWTDVHVYSNNGLDNCLGEQVILSASIQGGVNNGTSTDGYIQWVVTDMNGNTVDVTSGPGGSAYDVTSFAGTYTYSPTFVGDLGSGCQLTNTSEVQGTISVHDLPMAQFTSGDGTELCDNDPNAHASLGISFIGVAPFVYEIVDGNGNVVVHAATTATSVTIYVAPAVTTTYHISLIQDAYCSNTILSNEANATVYVVHCEEPQPPTVITHSVFNINATSVSCGGEVTDEGASPVIARGVCWSMNHNPTITNAYTLDGTGTGSFTSHIVDLLPNTTYYVKAYATNSVGTAYGQEENFTTTDSIILPPSIGDETFIYPNPTTGQFNLHVVDTAVLNVNNVAYAFVYDVTGHMIIKTRILSANTVFSLFPYGSGIYFLELNVNGIKVKTFKVVKVDSKE